MDIRPPRLILILGALLAALGTIPGAARPALAAGRTTPIATVATDSLRLARDLAAQRKDCVAAFTLAARQLNPGSDIAATASVFRTLAVVAHHGGDTGTTLIFSEAALSLARAGADSGSTTLAPFLLTQALAVRLSGRPRAHDEARELVAAGLVAVGTGPATSPRVLADLQQAEANLARARGHYAYAIRRYSAAIATRMTATDEHRLDVVDNECWQAATLLQAGDLAAAEAELRHCRADLQELGQLRHPLNATILTNLAIVALARGDRSGALALYREAATALQQAQGGIFPGFSRRRLASPLLNAVADLNLQDGDTAAAWQAFVTGHRIFGAQARALGRARRQDPVFAAKVRDQAAGTVHLLGRTEAALDTLRLFPRDAARRRRSVAMLARYARQVARTLQYKSELRRRFGGDRTAMPTAREVQRHLKPTQVLVGYFTTNDGLGRRMSDWTRLTYAVVLGATGPPAWILLPTPAADGLPAAYTKLIAKAGEWPTRLPDDPVLTTLRADLYRTWFAPLADHLRGKNEILLIAGELQSGFPFPALLDESGQPLNNRFAFWHLLGVESLTDEQPAPVPDGLPSLVLGDPNYDGTAAARPAVDPTLSEALATYANTVLSRSQINGVLAKGAAGLAALPPLQSSGWEARAIAGMTSPVTLLTGSRASEQNLARAFRGTQAHRFRWIHLATHALMHNSIPERSALALAPRDGEGLLYVEEIGFGWSLDCDLVTLSGCQTGSGPASWSSGPLGFIQALHAAGARNLLLSTGKVDDIATALLMERFYANVSGRTSPRVAPADRAPMSYGFALAEAQGWLRDLTGPDGQRPFAHPVYWAGFRLLGGGG